MEGTDFVDDSVLDQCALPEGDLPTRLDAEAEEADQELQVGDV
jgi:hypothetical protein